MREKLWCKLLICRLNQDHLQSRSAAILQRRHTVGVAAGKDNAINSVIIRVGRNVQANSYIYTLLLEDWLEIGVCKCG